MGFGFLGKLTMATKEKKQADMEESTEMKWPFGPKNYIAFAVALAVIIVGYILLGYGDITAAPILLVIGYCVLIPVAILIKGRKDESDSIETNNSDS